MTALKTIAHMYEEVNDGHPRHCTPEDSAVRETIAAYHGRPDFIYHDMIRSILLEYLPCEDNHVNACWHMRVTISYDPAAL